MQKGKLSVLLVSSFSFVISIVPSLGQAAQCTIRDDSVQIYISDSHIGTGGRCVGQGCRGGWHNMEDFRWHDDFRQFINYLEKEISKPIDLVMVGDSFELWQDMAGIPCKDDGQRSNFGCNAAQAKKRIEKVGEKHREVFKILSDFVGPDKDNKIIMLPGNHDAALAMNTVASTVKKQFTVGAQTNVCVDEDGILRGKDIFVEHGHQLEGDPNRYYKPLNGTIECIDSDGKAASCNDNDVFIRRSWGENFVQNYFNKYENIFPVIDNYSTEGAGMPDGVEKGFKASSLPEKSSAILGFLSFFFTKQTYEHIVFGLGSEEGVTTVCRDGNNEKCINVEKMGKLTVTDKIFSKLPEGPYEILQFIFEATPKPDVNTPLTLKDVYAYYSTIDASALAALDNMLVATCSYWNQKGGGGDIKCDYNNTQMGGTGLAIIKQWFNEIIDPDYDKIVEHVKHREEQFRDEFKYFIYGHTHFAEQRKESDKMILNTGAWQRVTDPSSIERIIKNKCGGLSKEDCFRTMTPDKLTPCYSFVASELGHHTTPTLFWWTLFPGSSSKWIRFPDGIQPENCQFQRKRKR